jgi:lipid II:glycine glycyltransferase (peptidoglycan interpeptide bridge formation enzyme)
MTELSSSDWDKFLSGHPEAHLLQTTAWGELKAAFGWQVLRVAVGQTGAQVLLRRLPLGFSLAYIPRGPVGDDWTSLWPAVAQACRRHRAILLKVEPDLWENIPKESNPSTDNSTNTSGILGSHPSQPGPKNPFLPSSLIPHPSSFFPSPQTVQPPRTILVNLEGDEETLLSRMKQKTRYNIRLAQKKEVVVRPSQDLEGFHRMMLITGGRDGFGVHGADYYRKAYELFHGRGSRGECELLQAEYAGQPLAALMVFAYGRRAWYLYGASTDLERGRMPTYLLQWEAMRWARQRGCTEYDLWGIPDAGEAELEAGFTAREDGLWGVYRFKRGFGGQVMRTVGAWDTPYQPLIYPLYKWWAKRRMRDEG